MFYFGIIIVLLNLNDIRFTSEIFDETIIIIRIYLLFMLKYFSVIKAVIIRCGFKLANIGK